MTDTRTIARISPNSPLYIAGREARDRGEPFTTVSAGMWQKGWQDRDSEFPLFIDVLTCTRDPLAPPVQTHRINYHSEKAQRWLKTHIWWSLHNGFTVHLATVEG